VKTAGSVWALYELYLSVCAQSEERVPREAQILPRWAPAVSVRTGATCSVEFSGFSFMRAEERYHVQRECLEQR
jgi:hypothetical protein